MPEKARTEVTGVDRIDGDNVLVEFSDGTSATYSVEELLRLRPGRELEEPESGVDGQ